MQAHEVGARDNGSAGSGGRAGLGVGGSGASREGGGGGGGGVACLLLGAACAVGRRALLQAAHARPSPRRPLVPEDCCSGWGVGRRAKAHAVKGCHGGRGPRECAGRGGGGAPALGRPQGACAWLAASQCLVRLLVSICRWGGVRGWVGARLRGARAFWRRCARAHSCRARRACRVGWLRAWAPPRGGALAARACFRARSYAGGGWKGPRRWRATRAPCCLKKRFVSKRCAEEGRGGSAPQFAVGACAARRGREGKPEAPCGRRPAPCLAPQGSSALSL
jgi:hypothetical protein